MQLYTNESSDPTTNARRDLMGRTHYVDPDTMRFHKSRVMSSSVVDQGLLFAIITSDALDYQNTKRGFRFVIFDLFGTVLERTSLESAFRTSEQARQAMWKALNTINAKQITFAAIERNLKRTADEMAELEVKITKLEPKAA